MLYEDLSREWTTHHTRELIIRMGDLNDMLAETLIDFRGLTEDLVLAKEIKREGCC